MLIPCNRLMVDGLTACDILPASYGGRTINSLVACDMLVAINCRIMEIGVTANRKILVDCGAAGGMVISVDGRIMKICFAIDR